MRRPSSPPLHTRTPTPTPCTKAPLGSFLAALCIVNEAIQRREILTAVDVGNVISETCPAMVSCLKVKCFSRNERICCMPRHHARRRMPLTIRSCGHRALAGFLTSAAQAQTQGLEPMTATPRLAARKREALPPP